MGKTTNINFAPLNDFPTLSLYIYVMRVKLNYSLSLMHYILYVKFNFCICLFFFSYCITFYTLTKRTYHFYTLSKRSVYIVEFTWKIKLERNYHEYLLEKLWNEKVFLSDHPWPSSYLWNSIIWWSQTRQYSYTKFRIVRITNTVC